MHFAALKLHFFFACGAVGPGSRGGGENLNLSKILICPRRILRYM
jgi:hypothetical protein